VALFPALVMLLSSQQGIDEATTDQEIKRLYEDQFVK